MDLAGNLFFHISDVTGTVSLGRTILFLGITVYSAAFDRRSIRTGQGTGGGCTAGRMATVSVHSGGDSGTGGADGKPVL